MAKSQLKDRSAIPLELEAIQGDVLIGLQKNFQRFIFFAIADVPAFKGELVARFASRVTTSAQVLARERELQHHKAHGNHSILPLVGVNVAFTSDGVVSLVPGVDPKLGDSAFKSSAVERAAVAGDIVDATGLPTKWKGPFQQDAVHGVFFVTGGTQAAVDSEAAAISSIFGPSISVLFEELANVRPGAEAGHEHFGWKDGISQPAVDGLNNPFPGQELLDPGTFVFGYGIAPTPAAFPWMRNGSFMVFRRLNQLVPEFDAFVESEANRLLTDPVLLGARLLGRWKSGAPMQLTPMQDDPAMGADPTENNNFDYSDDQAQRRCPFAAHIRKTNPRADIAKAGLDPHRIIRAGIPFGPEVTDAESSSNTTQNERGLMFVCYQTSIELGFEFVQKSWANNPNFVSNLGVPQVPPKHRPGVGGAAIEAVGFDPIIGQNVTAGENRARTMDEPVPNYPNGDTPSTLEEPQEFIVPTADAYFFVPSLDALVGELAS